MRRTPTQEPFIIDDATYFVIGAEPGGVGPYIVRTREALMPGSGKRILTIEDKAMARNESDDAVRRRIAERWEAVHGRRWRG